MDEIHERDSFADFLLIILRDVLPQHPQLRVVLMSATLHIDLFSSYFGQCPVIQVLQFPLPVCVCVCHRLCRPFGAYLQVSSLECRYDELFQNGERVLACLLVLMPRVQAEASGIVVMLCRCRCPASRTP